MKEEPYVVSVLVPVYGVEKYIERCAISLFEQTYKKIEYIFVNDCTKDNSVVLLKELCCRYPDITQKIKMVNHIQNRGIAATRNSLLENCSGRFFIFVDSDDWVEPNLVESLVSRQIVYDNDVVSCNYREYGKQDIRECKEFFCPNTRGMMETLLKGKAGSRIWGRLIKSSIVKDNNLRFIEGANFSEDDMMMSFIWFFANSHSFLNECLYNYERRNERSYTNSFDYRNSVESLICLDNLRSFFSEKAPQYLDYVSLQEAAKVSGHMILCSKDRRNKGYYSNVLLKRLSSINSNIWRQLPLVNRIAVYLHYFELVRLFVMTGRLIKRIKIKLKY